MHQRQPAATTSNQLRGSNSPYINEWLAKNQADSLAVIKLISFILGQPWMLTFMVIINSFSARTLGNPPPSTLHHLQPTNTFLMLSKPTKVNHQLPFSKPAGFFPPNRGRPLLEPNPNAPATGLPTHTLDLSGMSSSFPAVATLQELQFGTVLLIDEELFDGAEVRPAWLVGKARGVFVASSDDGNCHTMEMMTIFYDGESKDSLRFFGWLRSDFAESHVAIIGGSGKDDGANGYAAVKAITAGRNASVGGSDGVNKPLLYNDYLS